MVVKRRTLKDIDWALVVAPVALTVLGCIGIYSTAPSHLFVRKQIIFLVIGLVVAAVAMFTDYRRVITEVAPFFYGLVLVLLMLVLFVGEEINGNKAWLNIPGLFGFQPSEFAKLATILMLARYMSQPRISSLGIREMLVCAAIVMPPVVLIALGKDTGTMLTFGAILGAFYFMGGLQKRWIAAGIIGVAVALVAVYPHLKEYQQKRIDVIFNPEKADPRGHGYQTIQSMVAVGSGGVTGKGIGQGTQGKLGFLPYPYSDFIGAVIAEEMGLIGVLLMITLYLTLVYRLVAVALGSRDRAGALVVMGLVALITFHIACNLGMVVGLMPIMGIPLPLMSAGGTAVITIFAGVGIALSVRLRRFVN